MQIALVAVVLLAGMWFTVLKPKPADNAVAPAAATPTATPAAASSPSSSSEPVAPGVKGLVSAVDKAKGASAKSDATNAKIQAATGSGPATPSTPAKAPAKATTPTRAKAATGAAAAKAGTKAATAKARAAAPKAPAKAKTPVAVATPKSDVDPSDRLLAFLPKGKTLVILFEGKGADDKAARKAVHRTAKGDPKHVVSAYIPISEVGKYEALTSDINILAAPSILVIGTDHKATLLSGYVDVQSVRQAVGDARREAKAATAKKK